jgi:hypothetical protein
VAGGGVAHVAHAETHLKHRHSATAFR